MLLAGALLLSASVCDPDEDSYVKANEKLLATLQVMDGATHTGTQSLPHRVDDGRSIAGYSTQWTYTVPAATSAAAVEKFYTDALAKEGWALHRTTTGCLRIDGVAPGSTATPAPSVPFACDQDAVELAFRKGKVRVDVHLATGAWVGQFSVALDHDYTEG